MERPEHGGYSCVEPDVEITDLHAVPCIDGSTTNLCIYPARRGFEDIAIVCADANLEFAWSAVTFPAQGYVVRLARSHVARVDTAVVLERRAALPAMEWAAD